MAVKRLLRDFWVGNISVPEIVADPSWSQVEAAIRTLDGVFRTEVALEGWTGMLSIGGGGDRLVAVFSSSSADETQTLRAGVPGGPSLEVTSGGQIGLFDQDMVLQVDQALAAAKQFFDGEALPHSIGWRRDKGSTKAQQPTQEGPDLSA